MQGIQSYHEIPEPLSLVSIWPLWIFSSHRFSSHILSRAELQGVFPSCVWFIHRKLHLLYLKKPAKKSCSVYMKAKIFCKAWIQLSQLLFSKFFCWYLFLEGDMLTILETICRMESLPNKNLSSLISFCRCSCVLCNALRTFVHIVKIFFTSCLKWCLS